MPPNVTFSQKDMENLALAWQCFESEPKIDYDKFAKLAGYTRGSASVTMGALKRKLRAIADQDGTGMNTPKTPNTPASTKKSGGGSRKRVADQESDTPTKKKKGGKKMAMMEDEDEEMLDIKVKKEEALDVLQGAHEWLDMSPAIFKDDRADREDTI